MILTINSGSSSIRFAVFQVDESPREIAAHDHATAATILMTGLTRNADVIARDVVKVRVIRTDEELMIAKAVCKTLEAT